VNDHLTTCFRYTQVARRAANRARAAG